MKRKLFNDLTYNIIASALPVLVLQFFILPLTAMELTAKNYGVLIALISWINMISLTLGSVLNNTRLIENENYKERNIVGDFNILLLIFLIINSITVTIGILFLSNNVDIMAIGILVVTSIFLLLKGYLVVELRLNLSFKLILYDAFIMVLGYLLGYVLFRIFKEWSLIYLTSSLLSLIFILMKTSIIKEPFIKTIRFKKVSIKTIILLISVLLNSVTVYIDKILLLSLLGGSAVTVYYVASIIGKSFSLILNPISSVVLSYLSRMESMKEKIFYIIFVITAFIGILSYFILIYLSEVVLSIIYPSYVEEAMIYVPITILTAIIIAITGILNPIILRFGKTMWQLIINSVYLIIYIGLSLILLDFYGLIGFCYGLLISAIVKLILTMLVYKLNTSRFDTNKSEIVSKV